MIRNGIILAALLFAALSEAGDRKPVTSADKVKATATASKPDADGKQTVTITLDIEKDVILAANPVNHNHGFLDDTKLVVKITAKEQVQVDLKYPPGKTRRDADDRYDIYEGVVKIHANVVRTKGDASPLDVSIRVHGWLPHV
jgi:hypothetical protein